MGWWWLLIVVAGLFALVVSGLTLVLASMLLKSVSASDKRVGVALGLAAVAWLALPAGGTWLLLTGTAAWGAGLLISSAVASVVVVKLVLGSIGAAAQP